MHLSTCPLAEKNKNKREEEIWSWRESFHVGRDRKPVKKILASLLLLLSFFLWGPSIFYLEDGIDDGHVENRRNIHDALAVSDWRLALISPRIDQPIRLACSLVFYPSLSFLQQQKREREREGKKPFGETIEIKPACSERVRSIESARYLSIMKDRALL